MVKADDDNMVALAMIGPKSIQNRTVELLFFDHNGNTIPGESVVYLKCKTMNLVCPEIKEKRFMSYDGFFQSFQKNIANGTAARYWKYKIYQPAIISKAKTIIPPSVQKPSPASAPSRPRVLAVRKHSEHQKRQKKEKKRLEDDRKREEEQQKSV
eukprot:TRINITY_DN31_c0_g1_i7.p2 TRINITY_DN31_c0_g1~~TRINITY_DN31_c0_g1_i7.p2  ORF type:complete len:155 (-),score=36.99 TRINITY_DN31_c0_g1_i7:247-711(-)